MDDLGKLLGGALGGSAGSPGGIPDLGGALAGLGGSGGIGGLLAQLRSEGLGDVVDSWIGKGSNLPIDPAQLQSALGPGRLGSLASSIGLPIAQILPMLAGILPGLIDRITPDGAMPDGDLDVGAVLGGLGGLFGQD